MSEVAVITVTAEEWQELKATIHNISKNVSKLTDKEQDELVTIPQALKMLNVGRTTIKRYIEDGLLTANRLSGNPRGKMYIRRTEIIEGLNNGLLK